MLLSTACVEGDGVWAALDDVRCGAELTGILRDFGAQEQPLAAPPTASGGRVLRFSTAEIGRWIVVTQEPDGSLYAVERMAEGGRLLEVIGECDVVERTLPAGPTLPRTGARFTDADLAAAIEGAAPGPVVIYLWSPHMPLAVDGVAEIIEAGEASGVPVEVVLISAGDLDFARREAERVGMPEEALRFASSVELLMRDGQLHAPSILLFSQERVSPVLPGYRNAEGYGRFIVAFRDESGGAPSGG